MRGFDGAGHFDRKRLMLLDRFAQFALVTAREAVTMAQVEWTQALRERTAIVTGSCLGGTHSEDEFYSNFYGHAAKHAHPLTFPRAMGNAAASHISMEFGVTGPTYNLSTACASATHAIGQAFHMVRSGLVEMSLTGGSDSTFTRGYLKAWEALRVVAPDVCRPFSQDRRGMILGEGAAMLVLESLEAAQARSAHIYGEIVGFGMSADAYHLTQPLSDGAARAMRTALQDAGFAPEQIGYINAHGTGTLVNDAAEVAAIRAVFGAYADRLAISSTKSMHGHTLGANDLSYFTWAFKRQLGLTPSEYRAGAR